ncbi:MAG: Transcriptional regulatory protein TcrA [Candidatus Heimdallarchaeota archaeon LC_3]|nr:MAG: Transcriptional regulatory protein TcrA [Candidatus Heimdallarchaeota archaeon LC_3]
MKIKNLKILLVDDEPEFLEISLNFLKKANENLEIETTSSVKDALEYLQNKSFDVIVSDYQMYGLNGLDFLEKLRENGNTTPLIIFTGKGREEIAIRALNSGADFYLQKSSDPYVFTELNHFIITSSEKNLINKRYIELLEKYKLVMTNLTEGVALEDQNGKFIYANQKMLDLFEYSEEELYGKHWKFLVPPEEFEKVLAESKKRPEGFESSYELVALKKSGEKFKILIKGTPIFSKNEKKFTGTLVVFTDITYIRELESKIIF